MSLRRLACLSPVLLILACGGGKAPSSSQTTPTPSNTPMASDTAEVMATAFLLAEHQQAGAPALPTFVPMGDPGVFGLQWPASIPDCVTVTPNGGGSVILTFNGCAGPNGGTLNGRLVISWQASDYTLIFQDLQAAKGTQGWRLNGTRNLHLDAAARQATITVVGLTIAITDSANPAANRTVQYASALTADWATTGAYKLWGSFSAQKGGDAALTGTITGTAPLLWNAGCCYPGSGTLSLQQGLAKADLVFGQPCGSLTIIPFGQVPLSRILAACP